MDKKCWQQAKELFDQLQVLPAAAHEAFIHQQTENQPQLRQLVHKMRGAQMDESFMQRSPEVVMSEQADAMAGQSLGAYQVLRKVAVGGMGRIYQAQKLTADVPVIVALKIIRRELVDEAMRLRFDNEKQLLSKLNHHHIAALVDAGVIDDAPFLATEWIEGQPINEYVAAHALGVEPILALFLQVCEAVAHAHNQLIIHRDLKPANILVDAHGQVKLLDFGIAKLLSSERESQTQTQVFTPDYAAPEQINGAACTTATDVYALGVLLFELFVGSKRFGHSELSMAERIKEIAQPKTVFASEWMVARQRPGANKVKGALDNIINQAMHPDPKRRYHSVHALITDVHHYLRHLPVTAMGDGWWYRSHMFIRRNFWPSLLGLLLFVSLGAGLIYSEQQKQQAQMAQQAADDEAQKNAQMLRFFQTILQQAAPSHGGSTEISVREMFEQSVDDIDLSTISDPILRADIAGQIAQVYGELSVHDLRIRYDQLASDIYRSDLSRFANEYLSRQQSIAYAYRNQSRYQEALTVLSAAYDQVNSQALNPLLLAQVMIDFSELHRGLNQADEALRFLAQAEVHAQAMNDAAKMGKIRYYQFIILRYQVDAAEAERYLLEAMQYLDQAHPGSHPDKVGAKNSLAIRYKETGRFRQAVTLYEEIHRENQQLTGRSNSNQLTNHADAWYYLGNFAQTVALTEQALTILAANQASAGMPMMAAKVVQGRAMTELGQFSEAEQRLQQAMAFFTPQLPADHLLMLTLKTYWLDLLLKSDQLARLDFAPDDLINRMEGQRNASDDWRRRMINTLTTVASYHWRQGQVAQALPLFEQAQQHLQNMSQGDDWIHWYVTAAVWQLQSQEAKPTPELDQALHQLGLLLPANHWYHGFFQ